MSKQLRAAIEKLKHFYIEKILETGLYEKADHELHSFTVSELETIYRETIHTK